MRKIIMGCAVVGLIALSPKSEARSSLAVDLPRTSISPERIQQDGVTSGEASWYGEEFQGSTTASGEVFDLNEFTAAHPTLPFGTTIRVTNLKNNKKILLRVNDRGPHIGRRMLDVTRAAAARLGFVESGITQIRMEVVTYPKWFLAQRAAGANN